MHTSRLRRSSEDSLCPVGDSPSWHTGQAKTLGVHTVGTRGTEGQAPAPPVCLWAPTELAARVCHQHS